MFSRIRLLKKIMQFQMKKIPKKNYRNIFYKCDPLHEKGPYWNS